MSKKKDYEARIAELEEKLKAKDSAKDSEVVDSAKADENRADKADKVKAEKKSFSQKIVDAMGFSSKPKGMSLDIIDDDDAVETDAVVAGSEVPKEVTEVAEDAPEEEAPAEPVTVESDDNDELAGLSAAELKSMAEDMEQKVQRARQKLFDGEAKAKLLKERAEAKAEAEAAAEAEAKAKAEAEAKAKAEAEVKANSEAVIEEKADRITPCNRSGPGKAYKFWSAEDNAWLVTSNLWAASQIDPDHWKVVYVWYKDGKIDHHLTKKEIEEYIPI